LSRSTRSSRARSEGWAKDNLAHAHGENADAICKRLVQDLGCAGYLNHCVSEKPDVRSIAILREVLRLSRGLADFRFVMQGLGSGPIALAGSDALEEEVPAEGGGWRRDRSVRACRSPMPARTCRR
jgi:hypothetical protein